MSENEIDGFLKAVLPSLGLNWKKFQDPTFQRRIAERMSHHGLRSLKEYGKLAATDPDEQRILHSLLTVTISSFFRDHDVFTNIVNKIMPQVISKTKKVKIWCVGCAGGEEAYTLAMLIEKYYYSVFQTVTITATDTDDDSLKRARVALYSPSSLKEVPSHFKNFYFKKSYGQFEVAKFIKEKVHFLRHDFFFDGYLQKNHLVLCRNSVYTYCTQETRIKLTKQLYKSLLPGGFLVLGKKEALGNYAGGLFGRVSECIYRRNE